MRSNDGSMDWISYPEFWHIDRENDTLIMHDDAPEHVKKSFDLYCKNEQAYEERMAAAEEETESEPIEYLTIDYHRRSVLKANPPDLQDHVLCDYSERITICRESETIEYIQSISPECSAAHTYHVAYGVPDLLDEFDYDSFCAEVPDTPDDVIDNPYLQRDYAVTVGFKKRPELQLRGVYDKYGLPTNWKEIIKTIWDFIRFYGLAGEVIDPDIYGSARRRKSDLIILYVEFEDGYKEYCYLADEDVYAEGDIVDVPVGNEGRVSVAEVTRVAYLQPEEVPFPLHKIKHVIGHHAHKETEETLEECETDAKQREVILPGTLAEDRHEDLE